MLAGSNAYTDATTVSTGTLALSNASGNNIAASPTINVRRVHARYHRLERRRADARRHANPYRPGDGQWRSATSGTGSTITPGSFSSIGTLSIGSLNLNAGRT